MFEELLANKSLIIVLSLWLLYRILLPTSRWLGNLLLKLLQEKLKIKHLSPSLIQSILRNLLLFLVIFSAFYLSSLMPRNIVRLGDKSYIKHNKETNELVIYTDGKPQASFSKDGLTVAEDLSVTGSIYTRDIAIDMTKVTPDEVLDILKSAKGITLVKEEIAKEVVKETIKSLKAEGIIKESPSK